MDIGLRMCMCDYVCIQERERARERERGRETKGGRKGGRKGWSARCWLFKVASRPMA